MKTEGALIIKVKVLAQYLLLPAPRIQNTIISLFTCMAHAGSHKPLAKLQTFFTSGFCPALLEYYLTLSDSSRLHAVILLLRGLLTDSTFFAPALLTSPYAVAFSPDTPHADALSDEDKLFLQTLQRLLTEKKLCHQDQARADVLRRCAETVTSFLCCKDLAAVRRSVEKAVGVFKMLLKDLQPCFVQDLTFLLPLFTAMTDLVEQLPESESESPSQTVLESELPSKMVLESPSQTVLETATTTQTVLETATTTQTVLETATTTQTVLETATTTQTEQNKELLRLKIRFLAETLLTGDTPLLTHFLHYLSQSLLMNAPLLPVRHSFSLHSSQTSSNHLAAPLPSGRRSPSPSPCTSAMKSPPPPSLLHSLLLTTFVLSPAAY